MNYESSLKSAPGSPSNNLTGFHSNNQLRSPKTPKTPITPKKRSDSSEILSPLLLTSEITPLTSRDEDSAVYSDSDVASQTSGRERGRDKKLRKRSNSLHFHRRKRSDSSDGRSVRSSRSNTNQRIPQTTKVFRNLLILEESLRQQSKSQRALKRKFTAFILILAFLEGVSIYHLFFAIPAPSSVVRIFLQLLMIFILVTLFLYHLSGEYNRTIVIPRKFFSSTNKGLRQLNLKLVKVKASVSEQIIDFWRVVLRSVVRLINFSLNLFSFLQRIYILQKISQKLKSIELRAQPRIGVTDVKLVLNPRAFNSEIRETWELYRDEFWVKENSKKRRLEEQPQPPPNSSGSSGVLDKNRLVERHRKERKDRRRSRLEDTPVIRVERPKAV